MKIINWLFVVIGFLGLIMIRFFEDEIFYDPFLNYFQEANNGLEFPIFNWIDLVLSHLFRFLLNLIFSGVIIHSLFRNRMWTLQGLILILIVFLITFPIYLYCVYDEFSVGNLFSFYIRRFVIQPIILLLIIPLYYYRKHIEK